jgi:peptidoglycan/xylan/chitin deacetylase (PgdA/CDA1 family)
MYSFGSFQTPITRIIPKQISSSFGSEIPAQLEIKNLISSSSQREIKKNITLPVLMYHSINDLAGNNVNKIREGLTVSTKGFEEQLKYIQSSGYTTITSYELSDYISGKFTLPPKPIMLTFDDGMVDNYTNAFRILKMYNMKGDFGIITSVVGTNSSYVNWDQLQEMSKSGMSISSHTINHCPLAIRKNGDFLDSPVDNKDYKSCKGFSVNERLTTGQIKFEVSESKKILEQKLGIKVRHLIYPLGFWNNQVVIIARDSGYDFATTVAPARDEKLNLDSPYNLPRYRVNGQKDNRLKDFFIGNR